MKSSFWKWRHNVKVSHAKAVVASSAALLCALSSATALARTYRVGPDAQYKSLQDVANKLAPGDVVEVQGGATYSSVLFERNGEPNRPITIRGVTQNGVRPVIQGGQNTIEAAGNHYVFENLEITGGSFRCFFHRAHDITLRYMTIHDCPAHGILGADDGSGSMLLELSEIYRCGEGDGRHPIYMATDERTHPGAVFRMQFCYVHDGKGGNNVKSRAERNEIYFNWIEGARYHEIELIGPDGADPALKREDSEVIGNVIRKTNDAYPIRVGGDGTGETKGRYRFVHNTFLLETENRPVFRIFDGIESIEMHNNVFFAKGGGPVTVMRTDDARWSTGREVISGQNNWIPNGSLSVPAGWTATLQGSDPGFTDVGGLDLRPAQGSPLRNAAASKTRSPAGFSFPRPRTELGFQPPVPSMGVLALRRGSDGAPDIGAFEGGFAFSPTAPPKSSVETPPVRPGSPDPSRPGSGGGHCGCCTPGRRSGGGWLWFGAFTSVLSGLFIPRQRRRG